ncbi:MAG: hypothetical protein ABII09_10480 [Planctomycetota bacterium]
MSQIKGLCEQHSPFSIQDLYAFGLFLVQQPSGVADRAEHICRESVPGIPARREQVAIVVIRSVTQIVAP